MKSKKGFIADFIADWYSFIVYIIMLVLFFVLFSITIAGCKRPGVEDFIISEENDDLTEQMILLNFLRTPVNAIGKEMTMAEYIGYSLTIHDLGGIPWRTKAILKDIEIAMYGEEKCSVLCLIRGPYLELQVNSSGCKECFREPYCESGSHYIKVPSYYRKPDNSDTIRSVNVYLSFNIYSDERWGLRDVCQLQYEDLGHS